MFTISSKRLATIITTKNHNVLSGCTFALLETISDEGGSVTISWGDGIDKKITVHYIRGTYLVNGEQYHDLWEANDAIIYRTQYVEFE